MARYDQNRIEAELIRLRQEMSVRPIRVPIRGGTAAPYQSLLIGGGNLLSSGQAGILYNPTATPSAVYNPNLMPTMDSGLGWGYLYSNGVQQTNLVLIWNQFPGIPYALLSGRLVRNAGTRTLAFGGQQMTFYTVDFG